MNLLRVRRGIRPLSARSGLLHAWDMVLCMRIVKSRILAVIDICLFILFPILILLLAHTVHARTRVDSIVYGPIVALPTICERPSDFFEARVEGKVVTDRVLSAKFVNT
jgi:hypothetical protein